MRAYGIFGPLLATSCLRVSMPTPVPLPHAQHFKHMGCDTLRFVVQAATSSKISPILFPRSWELLAIQSLECPALWGPQLQRFQPLNVKLPNRLQGLTKQFSQRRHKRAQTIMPSYPPLPSRPTYCNHPLNHQRKANHFRRNAHSRSERNGMAKKAARLLTQQAKTSHAILVP